MIFQSEEANIRFSNSNVWVVIGCFKDKTPRQTQKFCDVLCRHSRGDHSDLVLESIQQLPITYCKWFYYLVMKNRRRA